MSDTIDKNKSYFASHINSAIQILEEYDGRLPFAHFIKSYFGQYKKFGSKDRKVITHLCYSYFRLGKAFVHLDKKARIEKSLALQQAVHFEDKHEVDKIFPWESLLSEGIVVNDFSKSFLVQPDLFLRIRPGFLKQVEAVLINHKIDFTIIGNTVRLHNATKIHDVIEINRMAVIQDASSQKVEDFYVSVKNDLTHPSISLFDCCAASGGKSILAKDVFTNLKLTVADIRPSIISNLKKRFTEAGITNYQAHVYNMLDGIPNFDKGFDVVVADVPCTGSGTWARTPEQLFYFDPSRIIEFANLQQRIIANAISCVKRDGYFIYITCSVFHQENEAQVAFIKNNGLNLLRQEIIKGYHDKADTMFAALFQKV